MDLLVSSFLKDKLIKINNILHIKLNFKFLKRKHHILTFFQNDYYQN